MRKPLCGLSLLLAIFVLASCGPFDASEPGENSAQETRALQPPQPEETGLLGRPDSWVDCERFAGVVTPATFDPASDPFDQLYGGGNGFKDGVPLISESKPGDADYNGGRWHLNVLKSSVAADKYANACKVEDLELGDFESTDQYFECPLLPRRGRGRGNLDS